MVTQSWHCPVRSDAGADDDMAETKQAVEYVSAQFREPLEAAGVNLASIHDQDEIEEAVDYARNYLCIESQFIRKCGTGLE